MKMLLGAIGLTLILMSVGCRTRTIKQIEYYEPSAEYSVKVNYTDDAGVEIENVKGPIKKETYIHEEGANEFSPGKEFNLNLSGIST